MIYCTSEIVQSFEVAFEMPVDPNNHVPIYEQIVDHVCSLVSAGVYQPDEMLPSIRALALELVVNPNTVQRAYQELERRKLITTRRGMGVFVMKNGKDTARSITESGVQSRFLEGIALGMEAQLPCEQIENLFSRTLESSLERSQRSSQAEREVPPKEEGPS